jgi:hypothetical protein
MNHDGIVYAEIYGRGYNNEYCNSGLWKSGYAEICLQSWDNSAEWTSKFFQSSLYEKGGNVMISGEKGDGRHLQGGVHL